MTSRRASLDASQVKAGDLLPPLRVPVTATTIVIGASATRDWQPQHHDHAWAERVGTRDIFMNTPTQAGWIGRYITDWAGPASRMGRMAFRMKNSIRPGDVMVLSGTVAEVRADRAGCAWVDVVVETRVGDSLCTITRITVALPGSSEEASPWSRSADQWLVAELPPPPERMV